MARRLRHLYTQLIENRKHNAAGWHKLYSNFFGEVDKRRESIKKGKDLSADNDKDFLRRLIYEPSNGIASRGLSILSEENFNALIDDNQFVYKLQQFIETPDKEHFSAFQSIWEAQQKGNNPVLVNRVAAACTLDVSTTIDTAKFNEVFKWLQDENIIAKYPNNKGNDWFSKNSYLMEIIYHEFDTELANKQTDKFYLSQFVWFLYEHQPDLFALNKQIVKYGPPGTGKTYQCRQQTRLLFDVWKDIFSPGSKFTYDSQIEVVQFHPSFSYEDFMEGLRPVLDAVGTAQLTLENGVFKEFCRKAGKWEIDVNNLGLDRDWDSLTIKELTYHRGKLTGAHWGYVFEIEDTSKRVRDAVPPFFFIIDEINRAELSRVFGELMYCLEYRGVNGKIQTQYGKLNNDETGMLKIKQGEYRFFIPTNVYLMGTMNTIDRSVESFDFALRRRFRWEEVVPDMTLLKYHLADKKGEWTVLAGNLEALNKRIVAEPFLGSDYQIGHAYLMNMKYDTDLPVAEVRKRVWSDHINPLLQEYLRGTGKTDELMRSFEKTFRV